MKYPKRITDKESFLQRVRVGGPDECWPYLFSPRRRYVYVRYRGRPEPAYRVGWLLMRGPIPEGMTIDHLCFNPRCMNPAHHEVVPQSVNSSRARRREWRRKKGWTATGDTEAAYGVLSSAATAMTHTAIASRLGVHQSHVSNVIRRQCQMSPEFAAHILTTLPSRGMGVDADLYRP